MAELRLAEVILGGDAGRPGEAAGLLEAVRPQVEEQRLFRNVVFRFLLASGRAARLRSDPAAPAVSPTRSLCLSLAMFPDTDVVVRGPIKCVDDIVRDTNVAQILQEVGQ